MAPHILRHLGVNRCLKFLNVHFFKDTVWSSVSRKLCEQNGPAHSTRVYCGWTPSSRQIHFDWPQILTIANFENINSLELTVQNGSILNFVVCVWWGDRLQVVFKYSLKQALINKLKTLKLDSTLEAPDPNWANSFLEVHFTLKKYNLWNFATFKKSGVLLMHGLILRCTWGWRRIMLETGDLMNHGKHIYFKGTKCA